MKKTKDILFLIFLCAIILFFGTAILLIPPRDFSAKENRNLSGAPKISVDSMLSGEYFTALGNFYKDQLPFRDGFTAIHSLAELSLGKTECNGVIPTSEGTLIALPKYDDPSLIGDNIDTISDMNTRNSLLYVPPRAIDLSKSSLPSVYCFECEVTQKLPYTTAELFDQFLDSENSYYGTDHHWTTDGAFFAYTQICKELDITPYPKDSFVIETVSENFYGTSFSKSGLPAFLISPDTIKLYRYENDSSFEIFHHDTNQSFSGFYHYDALSTTDKYRVFLGGNYAHISVKGADGEDRPKLLLIKDSFANSLIPFLALHYDIEVIDPRYCSPSFLREQLERGDFDSTLFVLSLDTLATRIFK